MTVHTYCSRDGGAQVLLASVIVYNQYMQILKRQSLRKLRSSERKSIVLLSFIAFALSFLVVALYMLRSNLAQPDTTADSAVNSKDVNAIIEMLTDEAEGHPGYFVETHESNDAVGAIELGSASFNEDELQRYGKAGCDYSLNDALRDGPVKGHRTDTVICTITVEMVEDSKGKRGQFKADPSGWPDRNSKVSDPMKPERKPFYLWNRSHLIADQLGGEATPRNAVTGTRYQNVGNSATGGMRKPEVKAVDYMETPAAASCALLYKSTPLYTSPKAVLPVAVRVDMRSCDGQLDTSFAVANVQPGYMINYETGDVAQIK